MGYGNGESGGVSSMGLGRAVTPRPPAVISDQMNTLDKMTEQIHGLISELEARINVVLQPEPPTTNKPDAIQGHGPVPLGATLGQMNDRLQGAANRLRNIIERVEL